ncbi:Ribosome assembly protein rrb1 [Pleurotus ostreatus]|nr:Ribosome assembly protein rrb1 [Pleurotus ostreatus]
MDWASSGGANASSLRLLTGDIHSKIYLTTTAQSGFTTLSQPFASHTSSVEDLQWSPSEPTVFASCSADQSVRVWDVRIKNRQSVAAIMAAHPSDVNVISWNKATSYLLLSGGDEGGIKVWDLRNVKATGPAPTAVASFNWHSAPITSIEWHPTEDSIFAASGADDQVTLWDLAVEPDEDEMNTASNEAEDTQQVPPQLLFVHQGQKDIKEVHWHPQIPGAVVSTASDGFNIFKTISV